MIELLFDYRHKNMKSYQLSRLRGSLFLVLFLYLFLGLFLGITYNLGKRPRRQEIFPVFSWFLFSKVPKENITVYNIIIHKHNEQIFNPGIPFEEADKSIVTSNKNAVVQTLINQMGNSYRRNQQEEFTKFRQVFEKNHLKGQVEYELVQERYSLLERFKTGKIKQTSLDFFSN